uniref:Signal recognition particle subunit SRP68 n=2 Tax=Daphnia sinensis TaxID=1820382 RepID=A0A4Y7NF85_9CRUS|nr:EOG090X04NF [Daphnia sinensis]
MTETTSNDSETITTTQQQSGAKNDSNKAPESIYTVPLLKLIKEAQQQHGLRHGDYQRYRTYCSSRLHRLRKVLHFPQGDRKGFKKREVTLDNLKDEKFIYLPLIQAERAWAYAMQLKQESNTEPRKKFHLIARLRKAVSHTIHLEYICQSPLCDARTKLEAQAYSAWMQGTLFFELQEWKQASEKLVLSQTIYEKLASALNEDEQILYKQRVEELNPNLRYCAYNIGDSSAQQDLLNMRSKGGKSELDALIAQTREKQAASLLEVTWRGRTVPVRLEKIRVFLLAYQGLDASLGKANDCDAKLSAYETILLDCKEAIQSLKEDLAAVAKTKVDVQTSQLGSQQYLLSYLTFLRATLTIDRNLVMVEVFQKNFAAYQSGESKKVAKPQEGVKLYEAIVQLSGELQQLQGMENDKKFQNDLELLTKVFKAFRCYYMALTCQGNRQWAEALALYQRAETYINQSEGKKLGDSEFTKYSRVGQDLAHLRSLVNSGKCAAHAQNILGVEDINAAMSGLSVRSKKSLCLRLDEFVEDVSLTSATPNVIKLPPTMAPVPCKPLFFDLALNHISFPSLAENMENKKSTGAGITGFVKVRLTRPQTPTPKMGDVEKKKKKKKKEEEAPAEAAPAPAPAAAPAASSTKSGSTGGSKKQAARSGSNVFSMFSQKQVAEFKEGFQLMDRDKDGILGKNDLRATYDELGRIASEKELDEMLKDAPGPINFTALLMMFAERQSGGADEDEVVIAAFKSFDDGTGHIDGENLRHALMTWGEKFTSKEVDDAFAEMTIDNNNRIDCNALIQMLTSSPAEETEGEAA